MSKALYLALMLGAIAVLVIIIVPTMLWPRCPHCGKRNLVDSEACKACQQPLPDD